MNARRASYWVVALLAIAGLSCVALRLQGLPSADLQHADTFWRLTYNVKFHSNEPGARLRLAFPFDTPHSRAFRQDMFYPGLRTERLRAAPLEAREVGLLAPQPGDQKITVRFDLHLSPQKRFRAREPNANLTAEQRAVLLRAEPGIQVDDSSVVEALQSLRKNLPLGASLVNQLHDFCHRELAPADSAATDDATATLRSKTATPLGRARTLVALCRTAKVPARVITGLEIRTDATLVRRFWVEALVAGRWEPFDPENGYAHELPHNFLAVRRDGGAVVRASGVQTLNEAITLLHLPTPASAAKTQHNSPLAMLDLSRLPLEMHEVLSLVLLLPIGALVTALFRTVVGISTFGTFTPTLLALSFIFADWHTGVFVFVGVVALGLVSRSLLDRLKLLMVPRLSVVLTYVVLMIVFAVSFLEYFHLTPSPQAVLLPMVILTMTIERFFITSEEDGTGTALRLLGGTIVVGLCCYLVLRWASAGELLLRFPELHFFTIALLILTGRYTGYRLTELRRFRDVAAPAPGGVA